MSYELADAPDQSEWDAFIVSHASEITAIDADALERGERNAQRAAVGRRLARRAARRGRRARPDAIVEELTAEADQPISVEEAAPSPQPSDRMLVAEVPSAGGRWHQVHFNEPAIDRYFRAKPNTPDRVYLFRLDPSGEVVAEPARPVVYSPSNVNHKIEFSAHSGEAYPAAGKPILVLRELGLRTHLYVMLFPGEPGHAEMLGLLGAEPPIGLGVPRVITTRARVLASWPSLPI